MRKRITKAEWSARMKVAREKDYRQILRRATAWEKRHIQGWKGFKGGTAWTMLQGGIPVKRHVYVNGLLDEWPYHVVYCVIVSMNPSLATKRGRNRKSEWWKLVDRQGKTVWSIKGPPGKVQSVYRPFKRRKIRVLPNPTSRGRI